MKVAKGPEAARPPAAVMGTRCWPTAAMPWACPPLSEWRTSRKALCSRGLSSKSSLRIIRFCPFTKSDITQPYGVPRAGHCDTCLGVQEATRSPNSHRFGRLLWVSFTWRLISWAFSQRDASHILTQQEWSSALKHLPLWSLENTWKTLPGLERLSVLHGHCGSEQLQREALRNETQPKGGLWVPEKLPERWRGLRMDMRCRNTWPLQIPERHRDGEGGDSLRL